MWLATLDPTGPGEQGGTRPVLVISTAAFNAWPVGLVMVVPLTTRERGFAHHVRIDVAGLDRTSYAMPEYLRSIAQRRLDRRLATIDATALGQVEDWPRRMTGL